MCLTLENLPLKEFRGREGWLEKLVPEIELFTANNLKTTVTNQEDMEKELIMNGPITKELMKDPMIELMRDHMKELERDPFEMISDKIKDCR